MLKKESWVRIVLVIALAAGGNLLVSCEPPYDLAKLENYIGPEQTASTQPSTQATSRTTTQPTTQPPYAPITLPPTGPVPLDVPQAIVLALNNNKSLVVDKYNPPITRTNEDVQRAAFDPVVSGAFSRSRVKNDRSEINEGPIARQDSASGALGLSEFLPTGTTLDLTGTTNWSKQSDASGQYGSRLGLTVTQSLLQGFGIDVNLASLRQARIDTLSSEYELRGLAQSIVAQTEEAYWDYVLAQRQIEIVTDSLELAQKQLDDTNERIRVGRLAETERAAPEAEVASRHVALIQAQSDLDKSRLALLRLISPPGDDPLTRELDIRQAPVVDDRPLDPVDQHVHLGMRMRPELNQARLQVQKGDLQIVVTKNGLLPVLDFFITMGKTGYAESFGRSIREIDGNSCDLALGVTGQYTLGNRAARAEYLQSVLSRDQAKSSVDNLAQSVELDVRDAYIDVVQFKAQITATTVSRKAQEEKLRSETEKFHVGKSTSLQVAQVQRDLLNSQILEVQAVAAYLKAVVELYRLDGSLLERRGIASPGATPVEMTDKSWTQPTRP